MNLTDEQWLLIKPLIAPHIPAQGARSLPPKEGRPPIDERLVLDGILWKISHNAPWYDMPPSYPSYQTCYRRYRQWLRLGVMPAIYHALLEDLRQRGGIDIQSLLHNPQLRDGFCQGQWRSLFDPAVQQTWQFSVLFLFHGLLVRKLKTYRTFTTE